MDVAPEVLRGAGRCSRKRASGVAEGFPDRGGQMPVTRAPVVASADV